MLLLVTAGEQKHQNPTPSSLVRQHLEFVGTRLSTSLIEAIHYKCQLLFLSVWKSDNKGPSFFILESLPYSSSCVPDQHPQPVWHKGSILWKTFLSQTEGGRGMVSGWSGTLLLLHILFLLLLRQPHLRLSGIWFRRLGSPVLDWHWLQRANMWGLTWHILALAAALTTPFGPHAMALSSCQLNRHFLYSQPPPLPSKCACKPHSSSFSQNLPPILSSCFQPHPCYYSMSSWPPFPWISPFNRPSGPADSSHTTWLVMASLFTAPLLSCYFWPIIPPHLLYYN